MSMGRGDGGGLAQRIIKHEIKNMRNLLARFQTKKRKLNTRYIVTVQSSLS